MSANFAKVYKAKREGGKYTREVKKDFDRLLGDADFLVYMLEAADRVVLTTGVQPAAVEEIIALSKKMWAGTAPTKRQEKLAEEFAGILVSKGLPSGKTWSWGAFMQAYTNELKPAVNLLFYVTPQAQSLHYAKGAFMLMTFEEAFKYAVYRNSCCTLLCKYIYKLLVQSTGSNDVEFKTWINSVSGMVTEELKILSKNIARLITEGDLETVPNDFGMQRSLPVANMKTAYLEIQQNFKDKEGDKVESKKRMDTEFVKTLVASSYPVDYLRVPLNIEWRKNGVNPKENEKLVSNLIAPVCSGFGKKFTGGGNYHKKDDPDFMEWHRVWRAVKRICTAVRTECNGGRREANNPARNRDKYVIMSAKDFEEKMTSLYW